MPSCDAFVAARQYWLAVLAMLPQLHKLDMSTFTRQERDESRALADMHEGRKAFAQSGRLRQGAPASAGTGTGTGKGAATARKWIHPWMKA